MNNTRKNKGAEVYVGVEKGRGGGGESEHTRG